MGRYLRLYGYFVRFSLSRAMEFRFDFFFRIVMDLVYYGVNLAFFKILFLQTPVLAQWNESQAMVFVGCYLLVDALNMTLFSNNMWLFPILVNRGDLDYYLVRPVSTFFFVTLRDFAVNSAINLLFAVGIFGWALARYPEPISLARLLLLLALLPLGSVLYFLVQMAFLIPVFWNHSARGWGGVFWSMTKIMERPDRIFRGWARWAFTVFLPFAAMASLPARLFLEDFEPAVLLHFLAVVAGFAVLVAVLWKVALRSYSSASS
ncbi:MAG: ABC-2 family transporter protein [Oligoflexia bacterium]|nr:ABC-2 family transporter protein [Oligoflexia bacterium]